MTITVYGNPAGQGNHRTSATGHVYETTKGHKPWRQAVMLAYSVAMGTVKGPVCCEMVFTLPRPKSAKPGAVPATRPDLSKLVRSTEDALTQAGAWEDDGRVVSCVSRKVYVGGVGALDQPGCVISIQKYGG